MRAFVTVTPTTKQVELLVRLLAAELERVDLHDKAHSEGLVERTLDRLDNARLGYTPS